jgi:hypothetical protein
MNLIDPFDTKFACCQKMESVVSISADELLRQVQAYCCEADGRGWPLIPMRVFACPCKASCKHTSITYLACTLVLCNACMKAVQARFISDNFGAKPCTSP